MIKNKQNKFLALYKPVHSNFEKFCRARAYGQMEPEDLLNESLLVAFEKFNKLKKEEAFMSFLFSIAVKIMGNYNRKKKEHHLKEDEFTGENQERFYDPAVNDEIEILHKALNHLPEAQKEAIILFEISGFSIEEVSVVQKASISAVKQRLKRGRENLKVILTPVFENDKKTSHGQ